MKKNVKLSGLSLCSLTLIMSLTGCQSPIAPTQVALQQEAYTTLTQAASNQLPSPQHAAVKTYYPKKLPSAIERALMPPIMGSSVQKVKYVSLAVNNMPVSKFLMNITAGSQYSVLVDNRIKGNITFKLNHVTVPEAILMVANYKGYGLTREGNIYSVTPSRLETHIFEINHLDISRSGGSDIGMGAGGLDEGGGAVASSVKSEFKTAFWERLKETVDLIIGEKGKGTSVVINPASGLIVVKAYPDQIRKIQKFIDESDKILGRQVIIEVKVLEVSLKQQFSSGINWKLFGASSDGIGTASAPAASNIFNVHVVSGHNFSSVLRMLSYQGHVSLVSSPRISTLNNQKALIKVGSDQYYVTNVSTNNATSGAMAGQTSSSINMKPFFSGLSLDVTPQISANNSVILHIHPVISNVSESTKNIVLEGKTVRLPSAASSVKESDNIVRAQSGQIIIIGGLMSRDATVNRGSVPGLEKLPLGRLATSKQDQSENSALVILIRPIVVGKHTWRQRLKESAARLAEIPAT